MPVNLFNLTSKWDSNEESSSKSKLKPLQGTWIEKRTSQKLKWVLYALDICVMLFLEIVTFFFIYFHLSAHPFHFPFTCCWILFLPYPFCFIHLSFAICITTYLEWEFIWEYQFTEIKISFVKKITLFRDSSVIYLFLNVIERKQTFLLLLLSAFSTLTVILLLLKIPNIEIVFCWPFWVFLGCDICSCPVFIHAALWYAG